MDRIDNESFRLRYPSFADEFVGREPLQGLETATKVVRGDDVLEMGSKLIMAIMVEALDGRVLDRAVHALDLAVGPWMLRLCQLVFDIVDLASDLRLSKLCWNGQH